MAQGLHSTIEKLSHRLLQRWVPKWYEAFCDQERGGFYERLGHSFKPVLTGQRRLVTQCRQLAIYSHAKIQGIGRDFAPDLGTRFDFIVDSYSVPESGGWIFSLDDDGKVQDDSYDLYGLAFVIFSFALYYGASGDERARQYAKQTLDFIDKHFRRAGMPGFVEALDRDMEVIDRPRRHESHMHLMEACLFAADITHDPDYRRIAEEMADLFVNYFYDAQANLLSEYYTHELKPLARDGRIIVEPGHYCEWIWLLKKQARFYDKDGRYDALCMPMLEWASTAGWDDDYGGIYDELDDNGAIVSDTKRLWPFAEALKANALMLDSGVDKDDVKRRIRKMIKVFDKYYMQERGFWTEWLRRDLTPDTDYMPGTTPYHVYFGIMETREVVQGRGPTRSLVARPQLFLYRLRRKLSGFIRSIRMGLKERNGLS